MSSEFYIYLCLGAIAGGFINGLSGTGTALFAIGFFLVVLEPMNAVALVTIMAILTGVQGLWIVRAEILLQPARLLRFVLPGLAGVPVGIVLLSLIDATMLRLLTAALLIVYGGYFSFRASLPSFSHPTPMIDMIVGAVGGVLGGAAGLAGAIPSMWLSIRPWTKSETRAVLQPFNMSVLGTTVALLFAKGAYDATTLKAMLVAIPTSIIAAQVGVAIFRSLSDLMFRRVLIGLTFLMGLGVLASEVF